MEVNSSTENSEYHPKANPPRDESMTKTISLHFNSCLQELESYQSRHRWYSISYHPILSIEDYRHDARAQPPLSVSSPAMPKLAILESWVTHSVYFTSIHLADRSWNSDYHLHNLMESSTSRKHHREQMGTYREQSASTEDKWRFARYA